jgi:hypothetical protein
MALAGKTALETLLRVLNVALLERIRATTCKEGECECAQDRDALHPLILENGRAFASLTAVLVTTNAEI